MAILYANVVTTSSSTLRVSRGDSSFSGSPAVRSWSPRLHSARNGVSKRRGNLTTWASSSSEEESSEKNAVPLWRKELTSLEDPTGENLLRDSSMEEDIARLQKRREMEKRMESYMKREVQQEGEEKLAGDGMAKSVIEKILVADFFFILFSLAWLVAGLVERSVLESTTLLDSWLPLWPSLFQPALGVFMAGAIVSAVSGVLAKTANK